VELTETAARALAAHATLEQTFGVLRLDARSGIDDFDTLVADFDRHRAFKRVLDGVADQVGQRHRQHRSGCIHAQRLLHHQFDAQWLVAHLRALTLDDI